MKKILSVILALALVLCFAACGSANGSSDNGASSIIGSWDSIEAPGTVYTFNEDGTGALDASGVIMNFTYVDKDGKVEITYEGTDTALVCEYTVKDNVLSLIDTEMGTTLTYNKK